MSEQPSEATSSHTRLLKCALEVEESRAYWQQVDAPGTATATTAFDEYWFGARSLPRIEVLLANMRLRFDAFPAALRTLHRWSHMAPETRSLVCHWHLQLSDPVYRRFTGSYLAARRAGSRPEVTRDLVVNWVSAEVGDRLTMTTRIQFASKLLSSAYAAGFIETNRDPRPLVVPRVPDNALEYLLYLLRDVKVAGELLDNPYLRSVDLVGPSLEARLRGLPALRFTRQSDLSDLGWRFADLDEWRTATIDVAEARLAGAFY